MNPSANQLLRKRGDVLLMKLLILHGCWIKYTFSTQSPLLSGLFFNGLCQTKAASLRLRLRQRYDMNNKRVLVTGGTGLVGAYLLRYLLQKGYAVRALRRTTSNMALVRAIQDQIEWLEGDILDVPFLERALEDMDQVYHSAALISFDPRQVKAMFETNITGTANIANSALREGVDKFVYISSIAAIGRREYQPHIDERLQWENSKENSNYAISKFKAENEVWRAYQEGLPIAIINPSNIIGAGIWSSSSCQVIDRAAKGLRYYPAGSTGFVDVRDVALAAIAVMESDIEGERYIVSGENRSYKNLFATLSKALDLAPPQHLIPTWLLKGVAPLETLRSRLTNTAPLLTREVIRNVQSTYYYHNDKIVRDLDFAFRPLDESLQETAAAYQQSKAEGKNYGLLAL